MLLDYWILSWYMPVSNGGPDMFWRSRQIFRRVPSGLCLGLGCQNAGMLWFGQTLEDR